MCVLSCFDVFVVLSDNAVRNEERELGSNAMDFMEVMLGGVADRYTLVSGRLFEHVQLVTCRIHCGIMLLANDSIFTRSLGCHKLDT